MNYWMCFIKLASKTKQKDQNLTQRQKTPLEQSSKGPLSRTPGAESRVDQTKQ